MGRFGVEEAAGEVRRGGVVAFPTETVYGLGADAFDPRAAERVFELKGRPASNPLIVHVPDRAGVALVAEPSAVANARLRRLERLWPGPLTVVLRKRDAVPRVVTGGGDTVGVRVPAHPVALAFLRKVARPVAAPSANRSTRVSPTTAAHVRDEFGDAVPVLDGGACEVGLESTVVSLETAVPTVLRPGVVTAEMLSRLLDEEVTHLGRGSGPPGKPAPSPGLGLLHYAPLTTCVGVDDYSFVADDPRRTAFVSFGPAGARPRLPDGVRRVVLSVSGDLTEVARNLFSALRRLDDTGLDLIVIDRCHAEGVGRAVADRVRRACAGHPRVEGPGVGRADDEVGPIGNT